MLKILNQTLVTLSCCNLLGTCGVNKNGHQITLQKTANYGITNTEIIELGCLVLIDYAQFEADSSNANPSFPCVDTFPDDSALLTQYQPLANIQGRDKGDSGQQELYGHVWRDQENAGLVISVRGTSDRQEWIDDAKFLLVELDLDKATDSATKPAEEVEKAVEEELGFHEIERSFTVSSQPGSDSRTSLASFIDRQPNIKSLTYLCLTVNGCT